MCIIVAKNKNDRLPTKEELKNCFYRNNDGAGFMYTKNNKVVIDKGYMNYKDFEKKYNKLLNEFNNFKNKCLVIHFRIGTSGTNSAENTHPYPLTKKQKYLNKKYFVTNLGVVHNGIIHDYTPKFSKNTNDTQEFIKHFLAPLKENFKNFYKNDDMKKAIEFLSNSKFTFLDKNDNLELIGDFVEENGLKFSNNTYKEYDFKNWNYYNYNHFYNETTKNIFEYNLDKLEPTDIYRLENGDFYDVGDKELYIDVTNYNLYLKSKFTNSFQLFAENVEIYNKDFQLIY